MWPSSRQQPQARTLLNDASPLDARSYPRYLSHSSFGVNSSSDAGLSYGHTVPQPVEPTLSSDRGYPTSNGGVLFGPSSPEAYLASDFLLNRPAQAIKDFEMQMSNSPPLYYQSHTHQEPWVGIHRAPSDSLTAELAVSRIVDGREWPPKASLVTASHVQQSPRYTRQGPLATSSDSGYASRRGDEEASIRSGNFSLDTPMDNGDPIFRGFASEPHSLRRKRLGDDDTESAEPAGYKRVKPHVCEYQSCREAFKLASELKKHNLKHERPYRCEQPGCTRGLRGFTTSNDLARHVQSVHRKAAPPSAKFWQCCEPGCKTPNKQWPRRDNFKSHLRRMHGLEGSVADEKISQLESGFQGVTSCSGFATVLDTLTDDVDSGLAIHHEVTFSGAQSPRDRWMRPESQDFHYVQDDSTDQPLERPQGQPSGQSPEPSPAPVFVESGSISSSPPLLVDDLSGENSPTDSSEVRTPAEHALDSYLQTKGDILVSNNSITVEEKPSTTPIDVASVSPTEIIQDEKLKLSPLDQDIRKVLKIKLAQMKKTSKSGSSYNFGAAATEPNLKDRDLISKDIHSETDLRLPSEKAPLVHVGGRAVVPTEDPVEPEADDLDNELSGILEALKAAGYTVKKDPPSPPPSGHTKLSGLPTAKETCQLCHKFTGRPCELRKHMKRHERPWGCTHCDKAFGSKGDWKRHENSQHFQHESWKCSEKTKDGKECGKITYHPENFKCHLSKAHSISGQMDHHLNTYRHSGNFGSKFWCGFCVKTINVAPTNSGFDAWSTRFNHIDNHFWGKAPFTEKRSILDWIPESKSQIASQAPSATLLEDQESK